MPIEITLTAESAAEIKQLVQDLAGTMSNMADADIPATTDVSTLQSAPAQSSAPVTPTAPQTAPATGPTVQTPAVPVNQVPTQASSAQPPSTPAVPTNTPEYTMEQLAVAATPLMDAGKGAELTNLLQQFGVQALTALPKERYGEFATALRKMGAKI